MSRLSKMLNEALVECNAIRVRLGRKPRRKMLKGEPWANSRCSIAMTIGSGSMTYFGWLPGYKDCFQDKIFSETLGEFAERFDEGKYPELIRKAGRKPK